MDGQWKAMDGHRRFEPEGEHGAAEAEAEEDWRRAAGAVSGAVGGDQPVRWQHADAQLHLQWDERRRDAVRCDEKPYDAMGSHEKPPP